MKVNYPEDIIVPAEKPEIITPYLAAYREAWLARFTKSAAAEDPFAAQYAAPAAPAVFAAPAAKAGRVKRCVIISIVFVLAALVLALAAISFFEVLPDYTTIFDGQNVKTLIDNVINIFKGVGNPEIMDYVIPIAFLASVVMAVVVLIISLVAVASKARLHIWIAALLMLLLGLASGVCFYIAQKPSDIIAFINPLENGKILFGYYITLGLQLIAFIFSCFSYRKVK